MATTTTDQHGQDNEGKDPKDDKKETKARIMVITRNITITRVNTVTNMMAPAFRNGWKTGTMTNISSVRTGKTII